jgi:predicted RNase H-like nuclease (RuvC/YqgF family)
MTQYKQLMNIRDIFSLALTELSPRRKLYLALTIGGAILVCVMIGSAWSHFTIRGLERDVQAAKEQAKNKEAIANEREKEAEKYRLQAERLEGTLEEIQKIAKKQDEELEKISDQTGNARNDAARARGVRALDSTSAELCRRLEELGHGCR